MRIRQITPDFWADPTIAHMTYGARLLYIGLWSVADDAGWLPWDLEELGARLFPYESPSRRSRLVAQWGAELVASRRVLVMDCGCGVIPTLERYQRHAGGTRSYTQRNKHDRRHIPETSGQVQTSTLGTERNVTERIGTVGARATLSEASARDGETTEFQRLVPRPEVTH